MSNDGKQDQVSGKLKKGAGKLTGDEEMRAEGETQESKGKLKETAEDIGDSVKGAARGLTGKDDGDR